MLESIALILLIGLFAGFIFNKIKLPNFIGMILVGIIIGPHLLNLVDETILNISSDLRQIVLVIILTRAGLSLNIKELKKVGRPAILMCFVPALFEMLAITFIAPLFFEVTYLEAAIIGSVVAAVSPAVIVPRMIKLNNEGYGNNKSIPSIILAGASVDDVFVIAIFTSLLSFTKTGEISFVSIVQVPSSIILGVGLGLICGYLLGLFFRKWQVNETIKVIIMIAISFFILKLQNVLEQYFMISGLLAIMSMAIMINQKNKEVSKELSITYNKLWIVSEIFLFVLVGVSVDINYALNAGIMVIVLIVIALLFRILGVYISLIKTNLNQKEKIFCALSYTPKATVQAAIGAIPLTMGLACGNIVLTVAVVSILLTAPFGAICIDKLHTKMLVK